MSFTSKFTKGWPLAAITLLLCGVVVAAAIIVSNTVFVNVHVNQPQLSLSDIEGLDGTDYPGGDRPDLISSDILPWTIYDFSNTISSNTSVDNVVLHISIVRTDGSSISEGDVALAYCDYNRTFALFDAGQQR